jgi:hypothetical protein
MNLKTNTPFINPKPNSLAEHTDAVVRICLPRGLPGSSLEPIVTINGPFGTLGIHFGAHWVSQRQFHPEGASGWNCWDPI